MEKTIMDVSRHQGTIDWAKVKASGQIGGVMIRAMGNSADGKASKPYIDPQFARNYAECTRLGIPVGVYGYFKAVNKAEADKELALLKSALTGLKTAVLNEVNKAQMKGEAVNVPDLAASFQERIAGILAEKLLLAAADTGAKQVCLAGGVAANGRLRQLVNDGAQKLGAKVYLPELKFCGDNGAMIAAQGYYQYIAGHTAGLELNGLPTLPIDYE